MAKENKKSITEITEEAALESPKSEATNSTVEEVSAIYFQIVSHRERSFYLSGQHESARLAHSQAEQVVRRELGLWHDEEANKLAKILAEIFPNSPLFEFGHKQTQAREAARAA